MVGLPVFAGKNADGFLKVGNHRPGNHSHSTFPRTNRHICPKAQRPIAGRPTADVQANGTARGSEELERYADHGGRTADPDQPFQTT